MTLKPQANTSSLSNLIRVLQGRSFNREIFLGDMKPVRVPLTPLEKAEQSRVRAWKMVYAIFFVLLCILGTILGIYFDRKAHPHIDIE